MTDSDEPKVKVLRRTRGKLEPEIKPIVLEYRKRRKKKSADDDETEMYSEGLEDIQRLEGDIMRVAKRSARVVSKGLDTYDQERKKSAKEKKDGAIEDFVHNTAKAASVSMKEASEIPMDIVESMNTKSYRKRLRASLRRASKVIRLFRI